MNNVFMTYSKNIVISLAAMLMAACGTETYPSFNYNPGDDNVIPPTNSEYVNIDKTPFKIRGTQQEFISINSGSSGFITKSGMTRGTGPVETPSENEDRYLNTTFHCFAFKCGATDFSRTAWSPNHSTANDRDNATCLVDGYDYYYGMPMKFTDYLDGTLAFQTQNNDTVFYSGKYTTQGYNVFGYHIDDWVPNSSNTSRNSSGVYYNIDLDGKRDIIMGSAKAFTQELIDEEYDWLNKTPTLRDSCLKANGGYSTISGRVGIQPHVILNHKLVRLRFEAYAQDEVSDGLIITKISVVAPTKATMQVAGPTPDDCKIEYPAGSSTEVFLDDKDADGNFLNTGVLNGYSAVWKEEEKNMEVTKRTKTIIGNATTGEYLNLLVPPQDEYRVYIYYKFDSQSEAYAGEQKITASISLGDDKKFEAGTAYTVRLLIWGPRRIDINASIQGGESGGYIKGDDIDWDTEDQ